MLSRNKPFLFFIFLYVLNCSSSNSYLKDRGNDLADIADISIGAGLTLEAVVYTGEYNNGIGICSNENSIGFFRGDLNNKLNTYIAAGPTFKIMGVSTNEFSTQKQNSYKFFRKKELDESFVGKIKRSNSYKIVSRETNIPKSQKTRIGFKVAYFLSFRFVLYTGEIADFFLGWFGVDIYNDDYHKNIEKMKEEL
jgi:hypothetical protein